MGNDEAKRYLQELVDVYHDTCYSDAIRRGVDAIEKLAEIERAISSGGFHKHNGERIDIFVDSYKRFTDNLGKILER